MLVRIVAYIWIVNFFAITILSALQTRLGTDKPDAVHSYMVHFRGNGDWFYRPLLGMYLRRVGPGIFMGGMGVGLLYGLLTRPKDQSDSKDI